MNDIDHIELWKMRKLIKNLSSAKGNGTSIITLALPPNKSLLYVNSMLTNEYGTATNIKSRVNRLSVLSAITSTQNKLKQYKSIPKNGLVIYCGTVLMEGNKEKKVIYDIIPFKPINKFIYVCDSKFHTEILEDVLNSEERYGFIVMDGNGALYGTVCGNHQEVLHKFTVDLPKKHKAGGQSALRFSRLRMEARNNYTRKVGEFATHYFINNNLPNIKNIILAGSADFKTELYNSQHLDPRLKKIVIKLVDIAYGGINGFNQAIRLSEDLLDNVKLIEEKKLLESYFYEITIDSGKYCFGIEHIMQALELGGIEKLIVWDDLELMMYILIDSNQKEIIKYKNKKQHIDFIDSNMTIKEIIPWIEWIAENYKNYGTELVFITDKSSEGTQFVKGFGGIGCILRWIIDFDNTVNYYEFNKNNDKKNDDSKNSCTINDEYDDFFLI
jgi:peptide chain release factor subunit 1